MLLLFFDLILFLSSERSDPVFPCLEDCQESFDNHKFSADRMFIPINKKKITVKFLDFVVHDLSLIHIYPIKCIVF